MSGTGLISKVLLAKADALCAAASPLIMDPDEVLLEGFEGYYEYFINNHFSIGIDAKTSMNFHQKREAHHVKCQFISDIYTWSGVLGSRKWLQSCPVLEGRTQRLSQLRFQRGPGSGLRSTRLRYRVAHAPVDSWGIAEVTEWLEALQLAEYADSFTRNDIRGRELLTLGRRDLRELGVTKVGHVKRILQAVRELGMRSKRV